MLKTYLYIPEPLAKKIGSKAKLQNKSKAEVIRQTLEKGFIADEQESNASVQVLFKLAELGKKYKLKGPKDSSERIDELLWGIKNKNE